MSTSFTPRHETASGVYISQAAEIVGVSPAIVRAWENQGLISPARTASGYRVYTAQDIERLRRVRDMVMKDGLNPAGVRRLLEVQGPRDRGDAHDRDVAVGTRIRALRKRKGVSLRELGTVANLSPSTISAIERGLSAPSVGTLQRLAAGLGATVPELLGTPSQPGQFVVRANERATLDMETPGVRFENLYATETVLQSILITVAPGAGSQEWYRHEGEEFIYVIEGELEVTLDQLDTYLLGPGDAMTFPSTRPHRWSNPGRVNTVTVWVNTPPTF